MAFRMTRRETIKAYVSTADGKLLASVYDSGFTTIGQVKRALISKIPYTSSKSLVFQITNQDRETTWNSK